MQGTTSDRRDTTRRATRGSGSSERRPIRVRDRENVDLLLLAVVRDGASGTAELVRLVRERSEGTFRLTDRAVHHELHRLRNERLVVDTGRSPRFVLTELGERVLASRTRQWRAFGRAMERVLDADG